jgi:hypothetical protein
MTSACAPPRLARRPRARQRSAGMALLLSGHKQQPPCTIALLSATSRSGRSSWRPANHRVGRAGDGEQAAQVCGRNRRRCRRSLLPVTAPNLGGAGRPAEASLFTTPLCCAHASRLPREAAPRRCPRVRPQLDLAGRVAGQGRGGNVTHDPRGSPDRPRTGGRLAPVGLFLR